MSHILEKILNIVNNHFEAEGTLLCKTGEDSAVFTSGVNEETKILLANIISESDNELTSLREKVGAEFNTEVKAFELQYNTQCKCYLFLLNPKNKGGLPEEHHDLITAVVCNHELMNATELIETLEYVDLIIYSTPPDKFKLDLISGSVKHLFGYDAKELSKHKITLMKRISQDDHIKFRTFLRDMQSGKQRTIEYKITDNFGKLRFVRHSGIPVVKDGKVRRIVGSIIDVTKEAKLREDLKNSEERFRLLIETANDFIFTLDKSGNFLMVNRNGAMSLGYALNEMIGKHFLEFVNEDTKAEVAVAFQKILSTEEPVNFEAHLIDNFGKEMIFDIQARCLMENDRIGGLLGIGRDVTKRIQDELKLKELNNKLIEANRLVSIERDRAKEQITVLEELNKLKNDFISNVSHELRTPLASIVGFAEAISSDPEMPREMINEFNDIIYTEGRRLAKLINDILDFSKLDLGGDTLEKSEFNLLDLLRDVVDNYKTAAEEKGITLTTEIPEAIITVNADKERIGNAIGHILSNAIKFTDKEGRVTLIVNDFLKEVEVIISDTGIGIAKEEIPILFEKFTKVNKPGAQVPGAGLGLAAAKKIIDLHNGLIRVKSEVNKGTTFIIRLPKKAYHER